MICVIFLILLLVMKLRDLHMRLVLRGMYQITLNLRFTNAIVKDFIASEQQERALLNSPRVD